ncbi:MAG: cupin domain-containing protein [Frankiales bacterium]|nr:cupin domain-containing protein [Frankiales bacterium]
MTANRSLLRRGSAGAPPHLHQRSAELFYLLDGALDVLVSDEITTLHPGDLLVVPAGVPHAFAPTSGSDADVLVVSTPGTARFDYYRLLDRLHRGQATGQDITDSQERFDNHYVTSATWQRRAQSQ